MGGSVAPKHRDPEGSVRTSWRSGAGSDQADVAGGLTMKNFPDHPVIQQMERYGYMQEPEPPEYDEDMVYEEKREQELFGDDL
jgi:hypothetical protein